MWHVTIDASTVTLTNACMLMLKSDTHILFSGVSSYNYYYVSHAHLSYPYPMLIYTCLFQFSYSCPRSGRIKNMYILVSYTMGLNCLLFLECASKNFPRVKQSIKSKWKKLQPSIANVFLFTCFSCVSPLPDVNQLFIQED